MEIANNILSREPLPNVRNAYAIISSEESHRDVSSSGSGTSQRSQSSVFNSNVGNRNNVQRPQTSGTSVRPANVTRTSNTGNRLQYGLDIIYGVLLRETLKDENLDKYIISWTPRENECHGCSMCLLQLELVSDHKEPYQACTHVGKFTALKPSLALFLITAPCSSILFFQITKLKIKVSHSNVTEDLITKVGNKKLTEHLTLHDVLVDPEYCVSLMYVYKVAKDSKFVIAFDELHCYVLPQDLCEMKVLGIGKQKDGLNYFDGFQGNGLDFVSKDPDVPSDDNNNYASSQSEGSNHSHPGPTFDILKMIWGIFMVPMVLLMRKNIEVASKLSHGGLEFSFRRNPRGGVEQAQFERLKEMVEGVTLSNSNHRWSWTLVGSGDFSVSSIRKLIDNDILPKGISKTRWIKEVPIKINVHAWKVIHNCLPTRFNISRRCIEIESILCPMSECSVESSRHLFISCKMISDVMRKITRWWDLEYRETNSFEDWCQWISSIRLPVK
nr:RNA-directed DNA polymerase, eukaryota [Tanacetum cinerariifolium]